MKTVTISEATILKHYGHRIVRVDYLRSHLGNAFVRETVFHKGTYEFRKAERHFL